MILIYDKKFSINNKKMECPRGEIGRHKGLKISIYCLTKLFQRVLILKAYC